MTSKRVLLATTLTDDALEQLVDVVSARRGVHSAEVEYQTDWVDWERVPTGRRYLRVRGTDTAVRWAVQKLVETGARDEDQDSDHDHADCIRRARSMGVPEAWAHTPETYLSM